MPKNLKKYLLTGIVVLLPVAVTAWLLWAVFLFIDGIVGSVIEFVTGYRIPGVGFAVTVVVVFLAGVLATNLVGRKLIDIWEDMLLRIPLANSVYRVVKQIVDTVGRKDEQVFRQVVLVEYPRRESWVIGFLIGEAQVNLFGRAGQDLVKLFVPTVPNPTSGFLVVVPRKDIIPMDVSVEDGFKMVLSAGIVVPNNNDHLNGKHPQVRKPGS